MPRSRMCSAPPVTDVVCAPLRSLSRDAHPWRASVARIRGAHPWRISLARIRGACPRYASVACCFEPKGPCCGLGRVRRVRRIRRVRAGWAGSTGSGGFGRVRRGRAELGAAPCADAGRRGRHGRLGRRRGRATGRAVRLGACYGRDHGALFSSIKL